MAAPAARGLFAKAIAQSAYMISMPALKEARNGHEPAEADGAALAFRLGASGIAELRTWDAHELAAAAPRAGFAPLGTVDGHYLPDQIVDIFERGEHARVPLLAGFNSGEIRSLPFLMPTVPATARAYEEAILARYGDLAARFLSQYPSDNIAESVRGCVRDALYGWTVLKLAQAQGAAGAAAFVYYFDHSYPAASQAGLDGFHACELPYLFGTTGSTPPLWPAIPATEEEAALSRMMGDQWISFAQTGTPLAPQAPDWADHADSGAYMHFAHGAQRRFDLLPGMFALNDEVIGRRRAAGDVSWNWNVGVAAPFPAKEK